MRNLVKVIDQVLTIIPATDDAATLKIKLGAIKNSAEFSAPEQMVTWWWRVSDVLNAFGKRHIQLPYPTWWSETLHIWSDGTYKGE